MDRAQFQRQLVAVAQRVLQSYGADIYDDGIWGSYTADAYERSSSAAKSKVDAALGAAGLSASVLTANRIVEKRKAELMPVSSVRDAILKAAAEFGLEAKFLLTMAQIESSMNPKAEKGRSKGLFQFQRGTWETVAKDVSLPPYDEGWKDPLSSARAAAALARRNGRSVKAFGFTGPITPAVLYLAHQQGAAGFVDLWKVANGLRDKPKYVTEEAMRGNPPHDKQGVTTDPRQFYARWWKVAQAKFGS
jgi:hypothetical protein